MIHRCLLTMLLVAAAFPVSNLHAQTEPELGREVCWEPRTNEQIISLFSEWLNDGAYPDQTTALDRLIELLNDRRGRELIDVVVEAIEVCRPDIKSLRDHAKRKRVGLQKPDFSQLIDNEAETDFVKAQLRLFHARWLAQNELYDEASREFEKLDVAQVVDPATLLFYRGLVQHQLLQKDQCVATVEQLLVHENSLPRRYAMVGKMILADISALEADSMDEISRMMADIRRRQALYRAGKIVRDEEQEVIKKLDKQIEELQKKRKQQQQQSGNSNPSTPMQESQNAGGQGSGDVTGKQQIEGGDWGNLPPGQRAAALAEMVKDLPPHYRAVIEEYFRKLAQDNKDN